MTKEEQNQIIKDALVRNLQKEDSIPEDIGDIYRNWLVAKVKQASALMKPAQPPAEEENKDEAQQEAS